MWTRLVAGAAAHDINNLAQGLFNLLALASGPKATPEALARYATMARAGLQDLQRLGADLRTLARSQEEAEIGPHRLDLMCADVLAETEVPPELTLTAGAIDRAALVCGTAGALRLAIQAVVRHALAASPPGGSVVLRVALEPTGIAIVGVDAPAAPAPVHGESIPLETLLAGPERKFRGDFGLIMAGAIARQYGGELRVGGGAVEGLLFKLQFPRAEEVPVDGRRA